MCFVDTSIGKFHVRMTLLECFKTFSHVEYDFYRIADVQWILYSLNGKKNCGLLIRIDLD